MQEDASTEPSPEDRGPGSDRRRSEDAGPPAPARVRRGVPGNRPRAHTGKGADGGAGADEADTRADGTDAEAVGPVGADGSTGARGPAARAGRDRWAAWRAAGRDRWAVWRVEGRSRWAAWRAAGRARWERWAPWRARLRIVVFGVAGALVGLALAGQVGARVGPFDTTVAVAASWAGDTTVRLAPLGTIQLDTHDWPLGLELRVEELGLDEAQRIADNPGRLERLGEDIEGEVRTAVQDLVARCLLAALVGGMLGALAARLTWRSALAGLGIGGLVVAQAGVGTAATFDTRAVAEPRYTGILTVAPRAVGDVEELVERFGEYRAQLTDMVGNIVTLYVAAEGLPTFEPDDSMIRLLHVSDVHLNPQAFDLMEQVVDQFGVDAVVDTGDIVDWGTATEEAIVEEIGDIDVPYVWVRGNHDSRATQRAVADQPNAVVLDGEATTVAGLRVWGVGDPRYTPNKEELNETETEQQQAESFAPTVAEMLDEAEPPDVDVAMVHDPRSAAGLEGRVPLVLAGHTHEPDFDQLGEDTVLLNAGSTGGAGLRGLQGEEPEPLTCTVLYFDAEEHRLVAYDRVLVQGLGEEQGATISRRVLPAPEPDTDGPSGDDTTEDTGGGTGVDRVNDETTTTTGG